MNCLCCGRPLKNNTENGWHASCIKSFFGTSVLPEIELSEETLRSLASESVNKGLTVPGVQKKLSLHLFSDRKHPRLTLVNYPTGYILKPQTEEYPHMPEAEHLIMSMADHCGIKTVPHALIRSKESYAYITKRVDRAFGNGSIKKFAMEDFCQLEQRLTQDKYKGSYERCSKVIEKYSARNALDQTELFLRLVFCFVTGNSDMHLKNFSLLRTEAAPGGYSLSPAYDLLPVKLMLPEDTEQMALTLCGKKSRLRRSDFISFAISCGIKEGTAEKLIRSITGRKDELLSLTDCSLLPTNMQDDMSELINQRIAELE